VRAKLVHCPGQMSGCPPTVQPSRSVGQSLHVVFRQKAWASVAPSIVTSPTRTKDHRCTGKTYHRPRLDAAFRGALAAFLWLSLQRPANAEEDNDAPRRTAHRKAGTNAQTPAHLEGAEEPATARLPRYFFRVGFETTVRDFADEEAAPGAVRTYHAFPIPGIGVSAQAYPLLGGLLGLDGAFSQSVGARSTTNDSSSPSSGMTKRLGVDTSYVRIEGALRARLPFSTKATAPWVAFFAGYGYTGYTYGAVPAGREIPSARYNALRLGADARIRASRFQFTGAAEYDHLLTIGDLGPPSVLVSSRAQVPGYGVTARLGASFTVVSWLALGVDGRLMWVTYDFVRTPSAQGTDRYFTMALSGEVLF
jgi:hypothetical protein